MHFPLQIELFKLIECNFCCTHVILKNNRKFLLQEWNLDKLQNAFSIAYKYVNLSAVAAYWACGKRRRIRLCWHRPCIDSTRIHFNYPIKRLPREFVIMKDEKRKKGSPYAQNIRKRLEVKVLTSPSK